LKPVRLSSAAARELTEAAEWYEARQPGLGGRLLDQVEAGLAAIRERPASFPVLLDSPPDLEIRRMLLPRFPYALIFIELPDHFRVVAVAHTSRRSGYWLDRLHS